MSFIMLCFCNNALIFHNKNINCKNFNCAFTQDYTHSLKYSPWLIFMFILSSQLESINESINLRTIDYSKP